MALTLKSSAFTQGTSIPSQYTCDGADQSPPLSWSDAPKGTQTFVLILEDPDAPAGTWDHWILYNLPASTSELAENIKNFPTGTQIGQNSWGHQTYNGPCPPDREHRYFFNLYALNSSLALPNGASKKQVESALQNHILEKTQLMGYYVKKQ